MVMLLWVLSALGAMPSVLGVGEARSVVLVMAPSLDERAVRCDDQDGDGVWTCPAGELSASYAALGLLIDGRTLVQTQGVTVGEAPQGVTIERLGDSLRVSASAPPAREATGAARPGANVLMAQVKGVGTGAPRLGVATPQGPLDIVCEDSGRFPDPVANDGTHTCAGLVPDGELTLSLRLPGQPERALGAQRWPPEVGLRQLRVDSAGATVASWPILDRASGGAPRREDGPRAQGPGQGQQPGGQQPGGQQPGGPQPQGQPPGPPGAGAALPVGGSSGGQLALAALGALVVGLAAWRIGRGQPAEIPFARALPPPPPFPGAPAGSFILRAPPGQRGAVLGWALSRLSASRPVLVVGPGLEGLHAAGPALVASSPDVDDVLRATAAIARRAIAPPAVLCSEGALSLVGEVGRTPEAALLNALPPGVIVVLVLEGTPAPVALPELGVRSDGGEWRA